jgi:hypothetical protein
METSNWIYKGNPITEIETSFVGFIYVITHNETGKRYFGKKNSFFKKTSLKVVTLKNGTKKKKKIRSLIPSDWPSYYGSSDALKKDVELFGKENFTREIILFCTSLSEMSYQEAKIQFSTDALLHPDKFYNSWIMCRVRRDHLIKNEKPTTILGD